MIFFFLEPQEILVLDGLDLLRHFYELQPAFDDLLLERSPDGPALTHELPELPLPIPEDEDSAIERVLLESAIIAFLDLRGVWHQELLDLLGVVQAFLVQESCRVVVADLRDVLGPPEHQERPVFSRVQRNSQKAMPPEAPLQDLPSDLLLLDLLRIFLISGEEGVNCHWSHEVRHLPNSDLPAQELLVEEPRAENQVLRGELLLDLQLLGETWRLRLEAF